MATTKYFVHLTLHIERIHTFSLQLGHCSPYRYIDVEIVTVLTVLATFLTVSAILSAKVFSSRVLAEQRQITNSAHVHATAPATITARWAALIFTFIVAPTNNAVAAVACNCFNFEFIYEHSKYII